jgi:hypothetical protein
MYAFDLKARRHFSAHAADAKNNGCSFQAHLIRTKAISASEADLEARSQVRAKFADCIVARKVVHLEQWLHRSGGPLSGMPKPGEG